MSAPNTMPILLLAAGSSSRMRGRDKLMEPVDGAPLVRRQAKMAREVTDGAVIVALPGPDRPRWQALEGIDAVRTPVPDADAGMAASIQAGLARLPESADAFMLLLADLPDLTALHLETLMDAVYLESDMRIWRGATEDGAPGHPVVFKAELIPQLAALTGDVGGRALIAAAHGQVRSVPLPGRAALNDLDTPEAWTAWRRANPTR